MTDHKPTVTLIVATSRNNVIGDGGGMPFRMKSDMKHFVARTLGRPIVMGRKTWLSLPGPLRDRRNIIMSRSMTEAPEGTELARNKDEVLEMTRGEEEIMIIGGGEVYRLWMNDADSIVLSELQAEFDGDTTFPTLKHDVWEVVSNDPRPQLDGDDFPWRLVNLRRRSDTAPDDEA